MQFSYKAKTVQGETKNGTLEALSRRAALDILQKQGFYVISLREIKNPLQINISLPFFSGVPQKEKIAFVRQFAVMLKSDIPPLQALKALVHQSKNRQMREIIAKMAEGIETGSPLSQVCSMHPKVFNNFFVSIVKSGEAAGKVSSSLSYLADHLEKDYNFNRKVLGALIYPIFVIVVLIGAFFLVTFFIIPKISEILQSFSGKLPFTTTVIIGLSHFVQKGGWAIIVFGFVALLILYFFFRKNPKTKMFYDKILLRVPIFGSFVMKINLVRLAENLSVLISSGLPITQALAITEDIMTNAVYKDIIKKAQEKVSQGEKISSLTQEYPQFISSFVTQMIATGEETGRLEETLKTVVDFYREETERTAANLTTLIEPVLILIMGIGIGFLAVGIFIPLFQIGLQGMGGM